MSKSRALGSEASYWFERPVSLTRLTFRVTLPWLLAGSEAAAAAARWPGHEGYGPVTFASLITYLGGTASNLCSLNDFGSVFGSESQKSSSSVLRLPWRSLTLSLRPRPRRLGRIWAWVGASHRARGPAQSSTQAYSLSLMFLHGWAKSTSKCSDHHLPVP